MPPWGDENLAWVAERQEGVWFACLGSGKILPPALPSHSRSPSGVTPSPSHPGFYQLRVSF